LVYHAARHATTEKRQSVLLEQTHNEKQNKRPYDCCQQRAYKAIAYLKSQVTEHMTADDSTDYAHRKISEEAKTSSPNHLSGNPARQRTNNQKKKHAHGALLIRIHPQSPLRLQGVEPAHKIRLKVGNIFKPDSKPNQAIADTSCRTILH
jgi:hypothetical protein